MKSQFLKIAGVKSEKAFYKKFPTEAAFFKAHPEAKKLVNGGEQDKGQLKKLQQLTDFGNPPIAQLGINTPMLPYNPNFQVGQLNVGTPTSLGGQPTPFGMRNATDASQMFGAYQTSQGGKGFQNALSQLFNIVGQQQPSTQSAAVNPPATTNTTTTVNILGGYQSTKAGAAKAKVDKAVDKLGPLGKAPIVGKVANIIGAFKQQKEAKQIAKQDKAITSLYSKASKSKPVDIEQREYVRPEDIVIQPDQLFPSYGVGTNVLAEDGASIGGNPTEIMNTFAPNTIYTDMGYEPLGESDKLKAYYYGGKLQHAQDGGIFSSFFKGGDNSKFGQLMNQGGGEFLTNITSQVGSGGYGPTGGNVLGGEIGEIAGSLLPIPGGKFIGKAAGQVIGGLFDKSGKKIMADRKASAQNISDIMYSSSGLGLQNQYSAFMEDGGYVSNDWQPQVIAKFGEYDVDDLLAPDPTMDTLRAGGQIRQNRMFEQDKQYALGGDLKVYRGEAEPMSYNPFLPDGGETVMFRGPSHDDGGMPIEYGNSPVEVEGGEPAVKLRDGGTGDTNLNVYGNLMIDRMAAEEIGDPKAKGMKYKNYVAQLSKEEAKANKKVEKAVDFINNNEIKTPFDKLKFASMEANILGSNMKLKDIADKKMNAAAVQNAINDTAEELGLEADALAKGKLKEAKMGAKLNKAQTGTEKSINRAVSAEDYFYLQGLYNEAKKAKKGPAVEKFQKEFSRINPGFAEQVLAEYPTTNYGKKKGLKATDLESNFDAIFGPRTERYMAALSIEPAKGAPFKSQIPPSTKNLIPFPKQKSTPTTTTDGKFPWMQVANQLIPYLRPSDREALDPSQLIGEMYALANNQVEPVYAQKYTPQLLTPYDISLQDQLNENQATFSAVARQAQGDPSVLSALAAQKYAADSKVLGEQMRINQAQRAGVYNQNIGALNQAQAINLATLDRQAERQSMARSATKATTQEALNSIAAKTAQNKLENRTLQTYENLYNYRFDPRFRAVNMNPLVDFEEMVKNASPDQLKAYETIIGEKTKKSTSKDKARNGSIVKALKNL